MTAELVDRIYEAAFLPDLWPTIFDDMAHLTDSKGGVLLTARDKILSWSSSESLETAVESYISKGWFKDCGRRACMFRKAHSEFLTENDYWTEQEFESNKIYNEFFRPMGLGFSAGTSIHVPTGDAIIFFIERVLERGAMEKNYVNMLNELRPHLARSAFVASRLGLQSATSTSETFSKLGLTTILLNSAGSVVDSCNITDIIEEYIIPGTKNTLIFKDTNANALLKSALKTLKSNISASVRSIPLRDKNGKAVIVAHLLPVCGMARDIFSNSYAICLLTPVTSKNVPAIDLVKSLFDCTASEAEIARSLTSGKSVGDISSERGVSVHTVRTQLKRVMEKTGCKRQAELVALMASVALN